jgi:hypothetical protein
MTIYLSLKYYEQKISLLEEEFSRLNEKARSIQASKEACMINEHMSKLFDEVAFCVGRANYLRTAPWGAIDDERGVEDRVNKLFERFGATDDPPEESEEFQDSEDRDENIKPRLPRRNITAEDDYEQPGQASDGENRHQEGIFEYSLERNLSSIHEDSSDDKNFQGSEHIRSQQQPPTTTGDVGDNKSQQLLSIIPSNEYGTRLQQSLLTVMKRVKYQSEQPKKSQEVFKKHMAQMDTLIGNNIAHGTQGQGDETHPFNGIMRDSISRMAWRIRYLRIEEQRSTEVMEDS